MATDGIRKPSHFYQGLLRLLINGSIGNNHDIPAASSFEHLQAVHAFFKILSFTCTYFYERECQYTPLSRSIIRALMTNAIWINALWSKIKGYRMIGHPPTFLTTNRARDKPIRCALIAYACLSVFKIKPETH
jgi:hypothetical protein